MFYTQPLAKLIDEFQKFPDVGPKSAQRMAFFVLNLPYNEVTSLARSIVECKEKVKPCQNCFYLSALNPCEICANVRREVKSLCVVADSKDVIALEKTREFRGLYHVLNGLISPLANIGPENLKIQELINRVSNGGIEEIILAINPTIEGDTTVLYLNKLLKHLNLKITRIAFGLPVGSDLELADDITLVRALEGRREVV